MSWVWLIGGAPLDRLRTRRWKGRRSRAWSIDERHAVPSDVAVPADQAPRRPCRFGHLGLPDARDLLAVRGPIQEAVRLGSNPQAIRRVRGGRCLLAARLHLAWIHPPDIAPPERHLRSRLRIRGHRRRASARDPGGPSGETDLATRGPRDAIHLLARVPRNVGWRDPGRQHRRRSAFRCRRPAQPLPSPCPLAQRGAPVRSHRLDRAGGIRLIRSAHSGARRDANGRAGFLFPGDPGLPLAGRQGSAALLAVLLPQAEGHPHRTDGPLQLCASTDDHSGCDWLRARHLPSPRPGRPELTDRNTYLVIAGLAPRMRGSLVSGRLLVIFGIGAASDRGPT